MNVLDRTTQVIEQYFFSHEPWNKQRHVLFTTVLLFSSMFSTYYFLFSVTRWPVKRGR